MSSECCVPSFLSMCRVNDSSIICFCWWGIRFHLRAELSERASVPFIRVWSYDSWAKFVQKSHKPHALQIFVCSFLLVQWTIWAISVIVVKMKRWDVSALFEHCIPDLMKILRRHITCRTCEVPCNFFEYDISFQTESIARLLQLCAGGFNLAQAILELGQWHSIDFFPAA